VSKEDHRATAEHVLKPGEVLHARVGAGGTGGSGGGSGGGGATWRGGSKPARGWGSGGADAGATRGARKGGVEAACARHMADEGYGGGAEKKQRSRGWRRKTRTGLQFLKTAGTPL
jgi:hypothetical protein